MLFKWGFKSWGNAYFITSCVCMLSLSIEKDNGKHQNISIGHLWVVGNYEWFLIISVFLKFSVIRVYLLYELKENLQIQ